MRNIVIDAGPLIALFDGSDNFHAASVAFIKRETGILHTNLAVITEVMHLLDFSKAAQTDFLGWVQNAVTIDTNTTSDFPSINSLMEKYADLPADFADTSLIALCERLDTVLVATIDTDFDVYKTKRGKPFTNVFYLI